MASPTMTLQAGRDLLEIWVYVAEQRSIEAANTLLRTIEAKCEQLAEMPGMGRRRDELLPGLRSFPQGKYAIYYRPTDDGIRVMRVLHGARNVSDFFPDTTDEA